MKNIVSKRQHIEFRLKYAEELLTQFANLTIGINPKFDIPARGGVMAELISLSEKAQLFTGQHS